VALRPPSGEEAIELGYATDLYALLRAIDEVLPGDATLYLEGTSFAPSVADFLRSREPDERPKIAPNTLWPKPTFFHLQLTTGNLAGLRSLAEEHAEPEVADHLVVYRGEDVLLWAHDAGAGYVQLSRSLPPETTERFRAALGDTLR